MSPHYPADAQPKSQYHLHDLDNGRTTRILEGLQTPGRFAFTHADDAFWFVSEHSSDPEWNGAGASFLYRFDLSSMSYAMLDMPGAHGTSSSPYPTRNGVLIGLAKEAFYGLAYFTNDGDGWVMSEPDMGDMQDHVRIDAVSEDGSTILFNYSTASTLPTYHAASITESAPQISIDSTTEWIELNKGLKKKDKAESEVYYWVGANNDTVNGILYYPIGYEEGKAYPLVLSIHGGPAGEDTDTWSERWSTYPNIMTEKGAFVLKPNYHGSGNHSQEFTESIKGHYYDLEMVDIMNGIRALATEGKVDTSEMGVMGWSNGAILATMLTVRYPDHFKCATPGAGDVNWTSDFGTCRFGVSFDQSYFGGAPWDDIDGNYYNPAYIEKSPLFELDKVKTPTLIFHGSEDRAVPRDQGWEYYRALQQIDKAPVRFLWFPGQPHGLGKISHQMRKMEEEIKWFDKYLFEEESDDNTAFDDESPLAMLLKREQLEMTDDGLYGSMSGDHLIPQTASVADDSIAIGVIEVTNAQLASFVSSHSYPPADANKPASGVSSRMASQYISALSAATGNAYRLPSEEEAKELHKKAKKAAPKENTLEHWAGYKPTQREVKLLRKKLEEVDGTLYTRAASFDPVEVGDAEVYDLGGNVAERSASGTYGYSAYQVVSDRKEVASEEHIGIRVILEN